jgi:hypothetical protein
MEPTTTLSSFYGRTIEYSIADSIALRLLQRICFAVKRASTLPATPLSTTNRRSLVLLEIAGDMLFYML